MNGPSLSGNPPPQTEAACHCSMPASKEKEAQCSEYALMTINEIVNGKVSPRSKLEGTSKSCFHRLNFVEMFEQDHSPAILSSKLQVEVASVVFVCLFVCLFGFSCSLASFQV